MSTINQISKDGTVYDISAVYDDLNNKISEHYVTKEELTSQLSSINELISSIQSTLSSIEERIVTLETKTSTLEQSVNDWQSGGETEGEATELDA